MEKSEKKAYFLCSRPVVDAMCPTEVSKPFYSGYKLKEDIQYFVAVLDFEKTEQAYKNLPEKDREYFFAQECVKGTMDVSKISFVKARIKGLFVEIEDKLDLCKMNNRAMIIYNLAERYHITPIEFINKIAVPKITYPQITYPRNT